MPRWLPLALLLTLAPASPAAEKEYPVPYRLTDTKHVLVRVKVNGKGPFNLILDTGAPAVFITKKSAEKAGLETDANGWAAAEAFEIEGGLKVPGAKARVADLFQLEGMNGMGLAGVELHGVVGYNVLARYRVTYDFTADKLKFVELDFTPPAVTARGKDNSQGSMDLLGPAMKLLAGFMGVKPNFAVEPRGFLGVELAEDADGKLSVSKVVPKSPADAAGLKAGDKVTGVSKVLAGKRDPGIDDLDRLKAFTKWVEPMRAGQKAKIQVERGSETKTVTVEFGKGL